jgi:hypothetical protein
MDQYVVRLWAPAETAGDGAELDPGLRGVVQHVSSGRADTFRDGCELLRRLVDLRGPVTLGPPAEADPTARR